MTEMGRRWRVLATGAAVGVAGVLGLAGVTASAQPLYPQPTQPSPGTVPQTGGVAPNSAAIAPQAAGQPSVSSATGLTPGLTPGATPVGIAAPAVAAAPTITPATSGTIAEFLAEKGVQLEPQASRDFKALNIVLPMPQGWAHVPDPNVPDAFAVIADRVGGNGLYSTNAQVVVYKLVGGEFDPKEAISHGFIDSQQLPAWRATDASFADFGGMPSSIIEGTYRENSMTLNTSRRHVLATSGPDKYLVTLSVTTSVDQVVAAADATDAIIRGFRVSSPTPPAPAPTPPAPGQPPAPQLLGLPG